MPELPEVETIRRQLEPRLVGRSFRDVTTHWSAKFTSAMVSRGATITGVDRRGKYLLIGIERAGDPWGWGDRAELVVHLGMTGSLRIIPESVVESVGRIEDPATESADDPYIRVRWTLGDAELVFRDVRRFGRIAVVAPGRYEPLPTLHQLGPEPLDDEVDPTVFWNALRASRRCLKTQLLSQRPIAGVGNIYADEACWLAGVNPADRSISRARSDDLLDAIRTVLTAGLDHGGTTLRDYIDAYGRRGTNQVHLHAYGRAGTGCDRCGTVLRSRALDARTTTWCPTCQPRR